MVEWAPEPGEITAIDAREKASEELGPVELGYARPRASPSRRLPPMSMRFAVPFVFAFVWPCILTATTPLAAGPISFIACIVCAFVGVLGALIVAGVRTAAIAPMQNPSASATHTANVRWMWTWLVIGLIYLSQFSGLTFHAMFLLHYPLFRAEVNRIATLTPGARAPHGWIGLFPIDIVMRGHDGEVGFGIGGDGITFDPTPATKEWFFVPPDAEHPLVGDWYWTETD